MPKLASVMSRRRIMTDDGKLQCSACKAWLPVDIFVKNKTRSFGLSSYCRPCFAAVNRSTPEAHRRRNKEYCLRDPRRPMLNSARKRAKIGGLKFTIELKDIQIPLVCPLLGIELRAGSVTDNAHSPSLDRISSLGGYTPDNVWVISHRANKLKNNATIDELEKIATGLRAKIAEGDAKIHEANLQKQTDLPV